MQQRSSDTTVGGAVVFLGVTEAAIARTRADGRDEVIRVRRRTRATGAAPFFVRVIHQIGERGPVVILGSADERTAFERELVSISHQPDRILEVPGVHDAHPGALLERLRSLRSRSG